MRSHLGVGPAEHCHQLRLGGAVLCHSCRSQFADAVRRSWNASRHARGLKLVAERLLGEVSTVGADDEGQVTAWSGIKGLSQQFLSPNPSLESRINEGLCNRACDCSFLFYGQYRTCADAMHGK